MDDPRRGLRSGSKFWVDSHCQVSARMEKLAQECGQEPLEEEAWKERGTRVHLASETGDTSQLTHDELRAEEYTSALADERASLWSGRPNAVPIKEYRFWLFDEYSAQADRVYFKETEGGMMALVQDLKPGFLAEWEQWGAQMEATAACVDSHCESSGLKISGVTTQIVTRFHGVKTDKFSRERLDQTRDRVFWMLAGLKDPQALTHPGPWCNRCRGRLVCESSIGWVLKPISESLQMLPQGTEGAKVLDVILQVKKRALELEAFYKMKLLSDPRYLAGQYTLEPGANVRQLEDVIAAWQSLKDFIPQDQFMAACSVSITALEEAFLKERRKVKGGGSKEAIRQFNELLKDVISIRQNKPSLKHHTINDDQDALEHT